MSLLPNIMDYNQTFVEKKDYERYITSKYPNKKIVVLTCMDTRLSELLPASMNFRNGDVKMIKSAGGIVSNLFGGIMRSILVAVYELEAEEVYVIGHYDCGMSSLDPAVMKQKFLESGIRPETISTLQNAGMGLDTWLKGFGCVQESVKQSVKLIRNHPLMPRVPVYGLVIHPDTGKLDVVEDYNEEQFMNTPL
jgi:carbonic anhydrase